MKRIALIGNPNSGKTTLFNVLTGTHQRVGNWPGVTVEKKTGHFDFANQAYELIDLPGTYSLRTNGANSANSANSVEEHQAESSLDEQLAQHYLAKQDFDLVINIIDAASLSRGLYLTSQLLEYGKPMIVAVNMLDVARHHGVDIDLAALQAQLGCPVIGIVAARRQGIPQLQAALSTADICKPFASGTDPQKFQQIDTLLQSCSKIEPVATTTSQRIDNVVLHPYLAFPIFLGVMYLMFLVSINVGSAFIDLFDLAGSALFVELPRQLMNAIGLPAWLTIFLADGVGGGVQLVGTFIPVIGALFLVLAFLEDSGYMARVAFIIDRLLRRLGLPGKSFVPLIVGFGCNVPAVMATRALDSQPDRILTTLMAPFMSCGARLTVYALFAAAFFPRNGQNVVFALYLIGIAVAVLSGLTVRKYLLPEARSTFVLELPAYHLPTLRNILLQTWQRLRGFVLRAGKAIVAVVIVLNVLNSIGSDGSVGNENTENSILSAVGKSITPAFAPMGISDDNWPATVGIFTGIFAKEVVVGTLDALYAPDQQDNSSTISELLLAAINSVPTNLAALGSQIADPLGLDLGDLSNTAAQAEGQDVQINTITAMQSLFDGQMGAFAYLLFVLLYMPCVATIGVIYKEIGSFWAGFSVAWSFVMAYGLAVVAYQVGTFSAHPAESLIYLAAVCAASFVLFAALIYWGRRSPRAQLIPVKLIDS